MITLGRQKKVCQQQGVLLLIFFRNSCEDWEKTVWRVMMDMDMASKCLEAHLKAAPTCHSHSRCWSRGVRTGSTGRGEALSAQTTGGPVPAGSLRRCCPTPPPPIDLLYNAPIKRRSMAECRDCGVGKRLLTDSQVAAGLDPPPLRGGGAALELEKDPGCGS